MALGRSYCSCYLGICFDFYIRKMSSFLKPHEPIYANFNLFLYLLAFKELKVKVLLWTRLLLKGILWLIWSSIQTVKIFSILVLRLFCSFIHIFMGVTLIISFKNFFFVFIPWLAVWSRGLAFNLFWLSACLPHYTEPILAFDLKWETCDSSFHLNT